MKKGLLVLVFLWSILVISSPCCFAADPEDVIIENGQMKLVIAKDGMAKSLLFKPTNEECLMPGIKTPISTLTQERPYQNEIKLAYPTKETTFKANSVRREGDRIIIGYELIPWEAVVSVKTTPYYIRFGVEKFQLAVRDERMAMTEPPVAEMYFLQLPVRNRAHFGDWLNVVFDDRGAINLLGTDPYAKIEAEEREGYRLLKAGVERVVQLTGVGAALITCPTGKLLDNIARVEEDFDLPRGVNSRRGAPYKNSYYFSGDINRANIDKHIEYAKKGGFRAFSIYYTAFMEGSGYRKLGNYDWLKSKYPNGMEDLKKILDKIKSAGMIPGFHFLHSHIGRDSRYVTPVPDHRLNLLQKFTLAAPLGANDTTIYVDQNPANVTTADNRRVLKIGTELISYRNYTTARPYRFNGCKRGIDKTTVNSQPAGYLFGVLDVSEFGEQSIYIDQYTDLQDEIAQKLADIYKAGFEFVYFDGSEGVNPPFWFNVAAAQWKVYRLLKPEPVVAEGAAKTHFSWHMLSRGNAFDRFSPEVLKESIRKFPCDEAPKMKNNFTQINFGWLGYWVPDDKTVGTQPDMLEYATSRAAAWDCVVSIQSSLPRLDVHKRTPDNLEVLRRWEEVRANSWLTESQKLMLQNLEQEHTLLINEQKQFEMVPYDQITGVANGSREVRAFTFKRSNDLYVVFWHISGNKQLKLPLPAKDFTLMEHLGKEIKLKSTGADYSILPLGNRRYLKTNKLSEEELISAFKNAGIME